ncbi:hypothetical protein MMPV_002784 [Pyropia vietnamensis]
MTAFVSTAGAGAGVVSTAVAAAAGGHALGGRSWWADTTPPWRRALLPGVGPQGLAPSHCRRRRRWSHPVAVAVPNGPDDLPRGAAAPVPPPPPSPLPRPPLTGTASASASASALASASTSATTSPPPSSPQPVVSSSSAVTPPHPASGGFEIGYPAEHLRWCLPSVSDDGSRLECAMKLYPTPVNPEEEAAVASEAAAAATAAAAAGVPTAGRDTDGVATAGMTAAPAVSTPLQSYQLLPVSSPRPVDGVITESRVDASFVRSFRMSSPYISTHRGAIFVLHIPGALISEPLFQSVMQDIALLHVVGVRLVLVLGAREQIEERLAVEGYPSLFGPSGVRITDGRTLQVAKEAVGAVRVEVEAALARGVINTPEGNGRAMSVICGNFYAARPVGVIDGEDYGFTGQVRRVEVDSIRQRLATGDLLLVSSLGLSPSGQVFNCQSESVAAAMAAQLMADKLIYLTPGETVVDVRNGSMVQNLPLSSAVDFLAVHNGLDSTSRAESVNPGSMPIEDLPVVFRLCLTEAVNALKVGVRRAHLLNRFIDGVLLMEIFHRDGVGFMISRDLYEGIRPATLDDIAGIVEVIRPLEEAGILRPRSRTTLEGAIGDFTVVERDGMIIACVSLTIAADEPEAAELGCFAVRPEYRKLGKGDALLGFIERKSFALGVRRLFILSTQSFHWFLERGFEEITVEGVPESKRVQVDLARKSKVYQKKLLGARAVDEEELLKHL